MDFVKVNYEAVVVRVIKLDALAAEDVAAPRGHRRLGVLEAEAADRAAVAVLRAARDAGAVGGGLLAAERRDRYRRAPGARRPTKKTRTPPAAGTAGLGSIFIYNSIINCNTYILYGLPATVY